MRNATPSFAGANSAKLVGNLSTKPTMFAGDCRRVFGVSEFVIGSFDARGPAPFGVPCPPFLSIAATDSSSRNFHVTQHDIFEGLLEHKMTRLAIQSAFAQKMRLICFNASSDLRRRHKIPSILRKKFDLAITLVCF